MSELVVTDRFGKVLGPALGTQARALVVAQHGARFDEAVERGNVFITANQTTVTTQAGLSATTPALTIANRAGSGKRVKLWYAGAQTLVAWSAAAAVWLAQGGSAVAAAVTETTNATVRNAKTGDASMPPGVAALAVATLPAAPVAIALLGAGLTGAITVQTGIHPFGRWFDGALQLPPGFNWSIQTSTAGTLFCEYIIEVVDQ